MFFKSIHELIINDCIFLSRISIYCIIVRMVDRWRPLSAHWTTALEANIPVEDAGLPSDVVDAIPDGTTHITTSLALRKLFPLSVDLSDVAYSAEHLRDRASITIFSERKVPSKQEGGIPVMSNDQYNDLRTEVEAAYRVALEEPDNTLWEPVGEERMVVGSDVVSSQVMQTATQVQVVTLWQPSLLRPAASTREFHMGQLYSQRGFPPTSLLGLATTIGDLQRDQRKEGEHRYRRHAPLHLLDITRASRDRA
jgi:hypothetical protein